MKHEDIKNILFKIELSRRNFLRPYFIEIGLTVGQGQPRILRELYLSGPMSQRELADACFLDVTTMSRTIDRLVSAGRLFVKAIQSAGVHLLYHLQITVGKKPKM